jgi:outer membrane protein
MFCGFALLAVAASAAPDPALLTRQEAEQIALKNNPRIQVSQLLSKVQNQVVRETRAGDLPNLAGNLTALDANQGSRLASGGLPSSILLTHVGTGVQLSQLLTDFGRTRNLIASQKLTEKARQADVTASREDIVLATDQVFFGAIEAQATLRVADQTVAARQALVDQVAALAAAKLKSTLDLSFAQVNLSQAKMLQLDARNGLDAAKASLNAVLGYDKQVDYQLVEDVGALPTLPPSPDPLIDTAIQNRPDLQSLHFSEEAAQKFSRAQHDQLRPTVSAIAAVGATPVGSSQYFNSNWYGAAGLNITIPIFNGFRYSAQAAEADLQTQAMAQRGRDLRNQIFRDVRTAWLNANTASQRVTVAAELLKQANSALDLAQTRYQLGLSSIVELSQAQLQQTEAAIGDANARSQYSFAIATLQFQTGESR